ncbi:hypothetical protein FM038_004375 [Shewanella eurypsychrophilus]|uniref:Uncharacterized protein n=2 Tax=Shewanella TaxID=22 RepID=A0ABX6VK33_9GAMM|nr:hypothetical protein [Shewanella eurypsychrophilus]QFU25189.1 hypothetical protein FS418_05955 [Shewanella sp. YLB-09]QPG60339.1 hypothetical protein FM038_004375 [Shewanella eurypsychrophilus]
MNKEYEKDVIQPVQNLLAPYANQTLSAFDNSKLVIAVIHAAFEKTSTYLAEPPIAYEVAMSVDDRVESEHDKSKNSAPFYCVKWQNIWVHCGLTNDYSASIQLFSHHEENEGVGDMDFIDRLSLGSTILREIKVPVMSLQQVEFMCMEYAHFDHC